MVGLTEPDPALKFPNGTTFDPACVLAQHHKPKVACSTACPGSSGESDAIQNWVVGGIPLFHSNGLIYKCGSIKIDGR